MSAIPPRHKNETDALPPNNPMEVMRTTTAWSVNPLIATTEAQVTVNK